MNEPSFKIKLRSHFSDSTTENQKFRFRQSHYFGTFKFDTDDLFEPAFSRLLCAAKSWSDLSIQDLRLGLEPVNLSRKNVSDRSLRQKWRALHQRPRLSSRRRPHRLQTNLPDRETPGRRQERRHRRRHLQAAVGLRLQLQIPDNVSRRFRDSEIFGPAEVHGRQRHPQPRQRRRGAGNEREHRRRSLDQPD